MLIEAGANVLAKDRLGRTPLDEAMRTNATPVVNILKPLTEEVRSCVCQEEEEGAQRLDKGSMAGSCRCGMVCVYGGKEGWGGRVRRVDSTRTNAMPIVNSLKPLTEEVR